VQLADGRIGDDDMIAQQFQCLEAAPALEVVPKGGQASDLLLLLGEMTALLIRIGAGRAQPQIRVREARVFFRIDIRLVLGDLARLLLARQVRGKSGQLLMAGLPQGAQLEEHQCAESGFWIAQQIAERIHLLLNSNGRAFLLLEPIAQQVKFILEVGVGFFQTRTILEQLHEPLFVGAR